VNDSERESLAWKVHWFRQSELEGALLLGRMVGLAESQPLAERLTRHCAEEALHSQLWAGTAAALELPFVRIFRSYQSFYLRHGPPPATLLDVLAFTQIFERRVHVRFNEELRRPAVPAPVRHALERMVEDEKDHLAWVAAWLRDRAGAADALERYRRIDEAVYAELRPYEQCLHKLPGLGRLQPATV
jgi:hypothetical protein